MYSMRQWRRMQQRLQMSTLLWTLPPTCLRACSLSSSSAIHSSATLVLVSWVFYWSETEKRWSNLHSPHRPQQNQHSTLHTLFSSYSLREVLLSKRQLSLINHNRVSGYTNKQLWVVISPFTPKIIIQILLTIQEKMYEWCSENW